MAASTPLDNIRISAQDSVATPAALIASTRRWKLNKIVSAGMYRYQVVASGHDLTTAGGIKLKVLDAGGVLDPIAYGAVMDGTTHPLSEFYSTLADAQVNYPAATALTNAIDWCVLQKLIAKNEVAPQVISLPVGTAMLHAVISLASTTKDLTIVGKSRDRSAIRIAIDDASVFTGTLSTKHSVSLKDLALIGNWQDGTASAKQSGSDVWLINLMNVKELHLRDCLFRSSQKGLVKARCNKSHVEGCEFFEAARGGLNVTGTVETITRGNRFIALGDDAISLHTPNASFLSQDHIVANNYFRDCQGIAALGAKNLVIDGNVGTLMYGRFVALGFDSVFDEGETACRGVTISNNVVTDLMSNNVLKPGSSLGLYVQVATYPAQGNGGSIPGNGGSGGVVSPLGTYDGFGTSQVVGRSGNIKITGNVFSRTLQADDYSEYGFGLKFREDGYTDVAVSNADLNTRCIQLNSSLENVSITDNVLEGGEVAVFFFFQAGDPVIDTSVIARNTIRNCVGSNAVFGTNASGALPGTLNALFDNNDIDGDPYQLHSGRPATPDGTWSSATALTAFFIPFITGPRFRGNVIRNVSRIFNVSDVTGIHFEVPMIQQCDPVAAGDNAGNKGIRNFRTDPAFYRFQHFGSDPTSIAYGRRQTGRVQSATAQPTTGKYATNEFVQYVGAEETATLDGNTVILKGWLRLTVGTDHVAGTDWLEVY